MQRPELWNLYTPALILDKASALFPLSNWTELDVWHYIERKNIPVVSLYFARARQVVVRGNTLIPMPLSPTSFMEQNEFPHHLRDLSR